MNKNSLYIQKPNSDNPLKVYGTLEDYGFLCLESKMADVAMKSLSSNNWPDEDGEDVYVPDEMKIESGTLECKLGFKGSAGSSSDAQLRLLGLFSKNSNGMKIYVPYTKSGYNGAVFQGFSSIDVYNGEDEDIMVLTAKFKITDPTTKIELSHV